MDSTPWPLQEGKWGSLLNSRFRGLFINHRASNANAVLLFPLLAEYCKNRKTSPICPVLRRGYNPAAAGLGSSSRSCAAPGDAGWLQAALPQGPASRRQPEAASRSRRCPCAAPGACVLASDRRPPGARPPGARCAQIQAARQLPPAETSAFFRLFPQLGCGFIFPETSGCSAVLFPFLCFPFLSILFLFSF